LKEDEKQVLEQLLELFKETLLEYFRDRGEQILSMISITGQKKVRIALRGIWKRYEPVERGPKYFTEVLDKIIRHAEGEERLREYGVLELIWDRGEPYIVMDAEKVKLLIREARRGRAEAKKAVKKNLGTKTDPYGR